jgi:hypothetical protein
VKPSPTESVFQTAVGRPWRASVDGQRRRPHLAGEGRFAASLGSPS